MKNIIKKIKQNYKLVLGVLVAGLLTGYIIGKPASHKRLDTSDPNIQITQPARLSQSDRSTSDLWTCSMHPQIRLDHPGQCPICGMELIPLKDNAVKEPGISADEIQMTEAALKLADVQTIIVKKAHPDKEVYLLGKVKPDERKIAELTARFGGRIEKLWVNFTGQNVNKGEKLATIYSPSLVTAQKELLEAIGYKVSNPDLYRAARNKLKLWDLTDQQIDNIETSGEAQSYFDILSPISGTVTRRNVSLGDYVKEGNALFQVIDLSNVWLMLEAYESDLPWIKLGDRVDFTVRSVPGRKFYGRIGFVDPTIDPMTRIARVRVDVQNPGLVLKPEQFADAVVTSSVAGSKKDLIIPKTAVLWTGKRAVVYVKVKDREQPTYRYREIVLGPAAGEYYVVSNGLKEDEEIAVNGVFKIDAAAQLAGKPSMMNPAGGVSSGGHHHAGMNMSANDMASPQEHDNPLVRNVSFNTTDKTEKKQSKTGINPEFSKQLTKVYKDYLPMKDAFTKSGPQKVALDAAKIASDLDEVKMELLEGQNHIDWMKQLKILKENLKVMIDNPDIDSQRHAFANFNTAFYKSIKQFGLSNVILYYQYCPMTENGNGAYWLSDTKEIRNPYFGDEMPGCGETKETLEF